MFNLHTRLSEIKAQKKLESLGYNELPTSRSKNILKIALEVVKEPMFILLIICGSIYFVLGDYSEGGILLSWVFIIILMTFYQHQKTEKALETLKQLSSPRALVIRDGEEKRIPGREVVPEDLVVINEGDRIPADGLLIDCLTITIDESILTGESVPINKNSSIENEREKYVFSGTLVVQGRGIMRVTKTGIHTEFGKIGESLKDIKSGETKLQKEIRKLIRTLFIIGIFLSSLVIVAFYVTRGDFITSILNGLATAMAMLPEEFPVVLTVFLALGAWRLSGKNVLTRKPVAIETLGSATVLCSDKTGTITLNKMSVRSILTTNGEVYNDLLANKDLVSECIRIASLACQENTIDPMDRAIQIAFEDIFPSNDSKELIKEYPLSKSLFAISRVVRLKDNSIVVGCKGAPEAVLSLCKVSGAEANKYLNLVQQRAEAGDRLLGVARAVTNPEELPESQENFNFELVGFIGFADPIRPEVPQAIQECNDAGIRVIMITGDYPSTALSIASQAGISTGNKVLTGDDLRTMDTSQLNLEIQNTNVFARIIPEQKLQIINALQANKEIVAMTGDGVNDAPALVAADIGIAMGGKGTDVARESSSLVLMDDNFASIVNAIRSGRKIYDNMEKAMSFIIAVHIPIIGLTLVPAFFSSIPVILLPIHIVFLELIIDPVCTLAFESEKEEIGVMDRPPRKVKERFFGLSKIALSSIYGLLLFGMVITIYFMSIYEGHSNGEIRAITFSSLIIGNIFLIITSLSKTRHFISTLFEKNIVLYIIISITIVLLNLILFVPYLEKIFSFEYPGLQHFIYSLIGAFIYLLIMELIKTIRKRKFD